MLCCMTRAARAPPTTGRIGLVRELVARAWSLYVSCVEVALSVAQTAQSVRCWLALECSPVEFRAEATTGLLLARAQGASYHPWPTKS